MLLRETDDSDAGRAARAAREKVMQELGLSEIEELRKRLNCREGLLIDFDYAAALAGEKIASDEETNSGENQGEGQTSHSGNLKPSCARTVS